MRKSSQKCGVPIASPSVQSWAAGPGATITIAIRAASTRYERRLPTVEMRNCTTGTDAARPKPLAACTIDSTSPRFSTN
jgi:hypothetical protein